MFILLLISFIAKKIDFLGFLGCYGIRVRCHAEVLCWMPGSRKIIVWFTFIYRVSLSVICARHLRYNVSPMRGYECVRYYFLKQPTAEWDVTIGCVNRTKRWFGSGKNVFPIPKDIL